MLVRPGAAGGRRGCALGVKAAERRRSSALASARREAEIVIAGGGPAGILCATMLAKAGVASTVLEREVEPELWSERSYTIVLQDAGQEALAKAGAGDILESGSRREYVHVMNGKTGEVQSIPNRTPGVGFTRPALMELLEGRALDQPLVTLRRGKGVRAVTNAAEGGHLWVHLDGDDGEGPLLATHVIAADGKWSLVRRSMAEFAAAEMISCPSWGILLATGATDGDAWGTDGTHVIKPEGEGSFYIIGSPMGGTAEAGMSFTMVCNEGITETYPWLAPVDASRGEAWEDAFTGPGSGLTDRLEAMLREEVPALFVGGKVKRK